MYDEIAHVPIGVAPSVERRDADRLAEPPRVIMFYPLGTSLRPHACAYGVHYGKMYMDIHLTLH